MFLPLISPHLASVSSTDYTQLDHFCNKAWDIEWGISEPLRRMARSLKRAIWFGFLSGPLTDPEPTPTQMGSTQTKLVHQGQSPLSPWLQLTKAERNRVGITLEGTSHFSPRCISPGRGEMGGSPWKGLSFFFLVTAQHSWRERSRNCPGRDLI